MQDCCEVQCTSYYNAICKHTAKYAKNPVYKDVVDEVYSFFTNQIAKAHNYGIKDVVLDVGIGFGKTLQHNLELLRHLGHFKTLKSLCL